MKRFIQTCIALFFAINLTGIGVALFVHANLGSDTITVFIDGLKEVLHCTLGDASRIYNLIALIIALLLSRKDIGWCTIVYALTVGFAMDFYNTIIIDMNIANMSLLIRLIVVMLGQLCFVVTYALLIKFREGMNQMDAISYGIVNRTGTSYKMIRTLMDIILLVSGWLMGGVIGVGSIIAMATTGVLVDQSVKIMDNLFKG